MMAAVILVRSYPVAGVHAESKIDELEARIKAAKEEKDETQARIKANKEEINTLSDTATSLKGALNDLNGELTDVSNNLEELDDAITDKNAEIAQMELDLEEAIQIENDQYEAMKIRIKYMYEDQSYDLMETLFGSANFSDFLNRSSYFESLAAYDRKKLEEFKHTREVVEEAKALLEEEKADLDELHELTVEEQNRVMQLVNRTSNSLTNYENEIAETEREMEENEAMLAEQQANITALQKELEEERRLSELANRSAWRDISQVSFAEDDRYLLANLIYCEAGNQPYEGQVAVGAVVINRVLSSVFPDTVTGVIYQNKQFSPVASGRLALALARNDATAACYSAADAAMSGTTTVGNCLFFRTPIEGLTGIQIGGHIFY
ncbi:MAG: cell wall hydrolase [Lachnospiraceae bacterium]|nr:cell wall hydrolase [Lachnospiraceae bacterium]